jgi:FkbM family methyltransferase
MALSRKRFLQDTGWLASGATLGVLGRSLVGYGREPAGAASPPLALPVAKPLPRPEDTRPSGAAGIGHESFSQAGEDLIVRFTFTILGIGQITYLDVGANDPIDFNNTYNFYLSGFKGVLVEPNTSLCEKLREVRPRDTTLVAGIGVTEAAEADYYVMNYPGLNTFSKQEADHQTKDSNGRFFVKEVIKMPLLNINKVMDEHFRGAPTFLSVDTEGLDLAILKSIDFARFRPKVICAETLVSSTTKTIPEIPEFMASQGYVVRGGSFVNTIFVDSKIL